MTTSEVQPFSSSSSAPSTSSVPSASSDSSSSSSFSSAEKHYKKKKLKTPLLIVLLLLVISSIAILIFFLLKPNSSVTPQTEPQNDTEKTALTIARGEDVDSAISFLDELVEESTDSEEKNDLRLTELAVYIDRGRYDKAENHIPLINENLLSPTQKLRFYNLLITLYNKTNKQDKSTIYLEKVSTIEKEIMENEQ